MRRSSGFVVTLSLVAGFTSLGLAAERPMTVSPGSAAGSRIGDACPTFSWAGGSGPSNYELVVYSLGEDGEEAQPVLHETFAGSASSWTPSLDHCLERGGQYAWSVRARGREGSSDWSPPSLFEVAAGPSQEDFEAALAVMQQYFDAGRAAMSSTDAIAETPAGADPELGAEVPGSSAAPAAAVRAALASWTQVSSVTWDDPEPPAQAVAAGAVAIGDGGVSLNPDTSFARDDGGTGPPLLRTFPDPSCSATNRGEIRLKVLTATVVDVDALCFCKQNVLDPGGFPFVSHRWFCLFN